jgi:hypothetical protein
MSIDFGDADHGRLQELMEKLNEGTLAAEEMVELEWICSYRQRLIFLGLG